jgi:hypothetical protein
MKAKRKFVFSCSRCFIPGLAIMFLLCVFSVVVGAQETTSGNDNLIPIKDVQDLVKQILHKKTVSSKTKKNASISILPSIGYNPSLGFVVGAKLSAIKQYGNDKNTELSVFGMEAIYTSRGIITAQARHNVFTNGNKWNFQGSWQLSKFLISDYGIGTGDKSYQANSDSNFLIKFTYIRLSEKIYRKIGKNLFAGAGVSFDIRTNINDEELETLPSSPHYRYSLRNGFNPKKYSANGLLLALLYHTREHPTHSYRGIYADIDLRFNQKWMGRTKNAVQLQYDFRKYFSLSSRNPEHVLAFWHWASYLLSGKVPYLELPATGYDTYNRIGRGYTIGRFKGPSFAYFETEYRFPITRNKLLSGVTFINVETASDDMGKNKFKYWEPAGGAGLRILFQKESRSTMCIDYARGNYGAGGFFFGLNEVF